MQHFRATIFTCLSFIMLCVLTACAPSSRFTLKNNYTTQDLFFDKPFGTPLPLPTLEEIFELTPTQKQEFLSTYNSAAYRNLSDSQRIFKYLKNKLEYFNFHSETLMASDALALNSGNCMSLAILTKSLAQLTHVGISFELARTPPVFQREGGINLSSQHIRSVVYSKNAKMTKQFINPNQKIKIDYFSTLGTRSLRGVTKNEFHSMFYSNRAAEALIKSNKTLAYWNLKEALRLKADNVIAINMLGVLYDQINLDNYAERSFRYGLSIGKEQLELLNNYHHFLLQANRIEEAKIIEQELNNYNDPDPFKWIDIADSELKKQNYHKAINFYEKAIEKADYLHQPYAGIAKANYFLGRNKQAIKAIKTAIEHAHTQHTTSIYEAKFNYLKSHKNPQ